ncbi:RNA polymerase factor sigma-54, partial [Bacillus sp. D-CC]
MIGQALQNGPLQETNEELANLLSAPLHVVDRSVELVQSLEPAGVGARNKRNDLLQPLLPIHSAFVSAS